MRANGRWAIVAALAAMASAANAATPRSGSGDALREAASARGVLVGAATLAHVFSGEGYRQTLGREHNIQVPELSMKWDAIHPERDRYNFCDADRLVGFAETNHMFTRGHTLLWHNQVPSWVPNGNFSADELAVIVKSHIETVVGRYKGRVGWWDVINEGIADTAPLGLRETIWSAGLGQDYMDRAFGWAHAADPSAKLFYNDYSAEGLGGKADAVYALVRDMVARGVPIHGVGLQAHFRLNTAPTRQALSSNIRRLRELGLEVHITELDVSLPAPLRIKTAAPLILTYGDNRAVAQNQDYSLNAPGNCAPRGSAVVAYLMGFGPLDNPVPTGSPAPTAPLSAQQLAVTATVRGTSARVLFAGLTPGFVGLMQLNLEIPDVTPGDGELQAVIGTERSNRPLLCVAP